MHRLGSVRLGEPEVNKTKFQDFTPISCLGIGGFRPAAISACRLLNGPGQLPAEPEEQGNDEDVPD